MIQSFETAAQTERGIRVGLRFDQVLFLGMIALVFGIRVTNLHYNSLFVDEAIYVTLGRNWLEGAFSQGSMGWMYGSYLYPLLAAVLNYGAGEAGLRVLSAGLTTVAAVAVYRATVRLFDAESAFWAMLIFGMTAISIDIGQLAVYDAPLVLFMAGGLFFVVRAAEARAGEHRFLLAAAACAALGTLSKYIGALYLPALVFVAAICYLRQGRALWPILSSFILPVAVMVGGYGWFNREALTALLHGESAVDIGSRLQIWNDIWPEIGVTSLMALAGLGLLLRRGLGRAGQEPPLRLLLWAALIVGLVVSLFAAPIYHLALANIRSAWKHNVYSLILLAPLAGYLCAQLVGSVRAIDGRWSLAARLAGLVCTVAIVAYGLNYALGRNYGFQRSWPDVRGAVAHLREAGFRPDAPVLAAGSQVYEYYLTPDAAHSAVWANTWYFRYGGGEGIDAMRAAIADRHFAWVILDDYYTPEIDRALDPDLLAAGYTLVYNEPQQTSTGVAANLRIYRQP